MPLPFFLTFILLKEILYGLQRFLISGNYFKYTNAYFGIGNPDLQNNLFHKQKSQSSQGRW